MSKALNCIVCKSEVGNCGGDDHQPVGGVEFTSPGHYGSAEFDPVSGDLLVVVVCDRCIHEAGEVENTVAIRPKGASHALSEMYPYKQFVHE